MYCSQPLFPSEHRVTCRILTPAALSRIGGEQSASQGGGKVAEAALWSRLERAGFAIHSRMGGGVSIVRKEREGGIVVGGRGMRKNWQQQEARFQGDYTYDDV